MINFKKICRILLLAAFVCTLSGVRYVKAEFGLNNINNDHYMYGTEYSSYEACESKCIGEGYRCVDAFSGKGKNGQRQYVCQHYDESTTNNPETNEPEKPVTPAGGNAKQSQSAITGCSSDYGLFSGLITTGRTIFKGLRDLIYVVAGFGIIGVAVGGFFGNLNWKWLGAIVIALVVIASTGEIINMITGCENFTKSMITDTLK